MRRAGLFLGLMSGTSADGLDVALVRVEGPSGPERVRPGAVRARLLAWACEPMPDDLRRRLFRAFPPRRVPAAELARLHVELAEAFAAAAAGLLRRAGVAPAEVEAAGFHGQTVYHEPPPAPVPVTWQLGSAAHLAERLGVPVVSDFRSRDLAAGGQGAPLVPFADWLTLTHPRRGRVVLNLGGIANLTYLPPGAGRDNVVAFDTGPGNMAMDAAVTLLSRGRQRFDRDGRLARAGRPDPDLLRALLAHPYFDRPPPKSTGREEFGRPWVRDILSRTRLPAADLLATLARLTVVTVAHAVRRFVRPRGPVDEVIVGGGGARNPVLMAGLREALAPARVYAHDRLGVPAEAREAFAFALLAWAHARGVPAGMPSVTGARRAAVLGSYTPAGGRAAGGGGRRGA